MPTLASRRLLLFAFVCTALIAAFSTHAADSLVRAAPAPIPDVTVLLRIAQRKVNTHPGFSRALLHSATGTVSGGGNATTAADINSWTFVYDNSPTPKAVNFSASLTYAARAYGTVTPGPHLGFGLDNIRSLPVMTLAHAVQLLRKAGITDAFSEVTLRTVPGPGGDSPDYDFDLASGGEASVDTKTAKVTSFIPE